MDIAVNNELENINYKTYRGEMMEFGYTEDSQYKNRGVVGGDNSLSQIVSSQQLSPSNDCGGAIHAQTALNTTEQMQRVESEKGSEFYPAINLFIVTPVLNGIKYLEQTINSIFCQTGFFNLHYHIQDGGSTDGTVEYLQDLKSKVNSGEIKPLNTGEFHFSYVSEKDESIYDAINKGVANFKIGPNDIMTWINSDDLFFAESFRVVSKIFAEMPSIKWLSGINAVVNKDNGLDLSFVPHCRMLISKGVCDGEHWPHIQQEGSFWRYSLWKAVGGLDTKFKLAGDWDLWRRFAHHSDLCQIPQALGCFRSREGQLSANIGGYKAEMHGVSFPWQVKEDFMKTVYLNPENLFCNLVESFSAKYQILRNRLSYNRFVVYAFRYADWKNSQNMASNCSANTNCGVVGSFDTKGGRVRSLLRKLKLYLKLVKSGTFMENYYLETNPDVASLGCNPLWHYISCGDREGRSPNPLLNPNWYRAKYSDVQNTNTLFHYLAFGGKEGRDPCPEFSTNGYLDKNVDVKNAGVNPLFHYIHHGLLEGREF